MPHAGARLAKHGVQLRSLFFLWKLRGGLLAAKCPGQKTTLAVIAKINNPLYRVYLLKEQLRAVFQVKGAPGRALLAGWLAWAQRCRILEFVKLARTIKLFLPLIYNTLDHGLSNALSEATNTHIRLLTRRAYGYHSPDALIAMATLTRGGLCPPLPGRS